MSLPEVLLWQRLRGGRTGLKFRRQHPIGPYVVDFYSAEAKLIIEIDGTVHDWRQDADIGRDAFLSENGYMVLHFPAAEVLADPVRVTEGITALAARPLHRPADGPPPRAGEDMA